LGAQAKGLNRNSEPAKLSKVTNRDAYVLRENTGTSGVKQTAHP